jgi:hypothetical protein
MNEHKSIELRPLDWLQSGDTGSSSKAIAAFMQGRSSSGDFPFDSSDFGRCHRLFQAIPEWRNRLPEMAVKFPHWKPLVAIWAELEKLWPDADAVNKRMKSSVNASAKQDGWMNFGTNCRIKIGK